MNSSKQLLSNPWYEVYQMLLCWDSQHSSCSPWWSNWTYHPNHLDMVANNRWPQKHLVYSGNPSRNLCTMEVFWLSPRGLPWHHQQKSNFFSFSYQLLLNPNVLWFPLLWEKSVNAVISCVVGAWFRGKKITPPPTPLFWFISAWQIRILQKCFQNIKERKEKNEITASAAAIPIKHCGD